MRESCLITWVWGFSLPIKRPKEFTWKSQEKIGTKLFYLPIKQGQVCKDLQ